MSFCIGCIGGSGSGKSFLMELLKHHFKTYHPAHLNMDDYYLPKEFQQIDAFGAINFDLPSAIDIERFNSDLTELKKGLSIENRKYTYNTNSSSKTQYIQSSSLLFVEGLYLFENNHLRQQFDFTVFVEADLSVQLERRIARDLFERNYPKEAVLHQWEHHVLPSFYTHILPHKSTVDFCWLNSSDWEESFNQLVQLIEQKVAHVEPTTQHLST